MKQLEEERRKQYQVNVLQLHGYLSQYDSIIVLAIELFLHNVKLQAVKNYDLSDVHMKRSGK